MSKENPFLLTPGPLTTSMATKQAMLNDWGSWDADFNRITAEVGDYLLRCANAVHTHVFIPMQGSGTFSVEAALGTLIAPKQKTLVLCNGAYGQRMATILKTMGRPYVVLDKGDFEAPQVDEVHELLLADPEISAVAMVHCETSSGILNEIDDIASLCRALGKLFILDSMSAFGAIDIDVINTPFTALISSANKCFEGVPGFGFVLAHKQHLQHCKGNSPSLSLDLYEQYQYMGKTGQWRFTPPTHSVVAFHKALEQHREEGGVAGRFERYLSNRIRLVQGMRALGFKTLLEDRWLSPIITTFLSPDDERFDFQQFYQLVKQQGFIIYPGKLTQCESFRIGNIGQLYSEQIDAVLVAVQNACSQMGVVLVKTEEGVNQ